MLVRRKAPTLILVGFSAPAALRPIDQQIFDLLAATAAEGKPCPTNKEICLRFGFRSVGTPSLVLQRLERLGFIRILSYAKCRAVQIVATGKQTHVPSGSLPWLGRKAHSDRIPREFRQLEAPPARMPLPPAPPSPVCMFYAGDPRRGDPPCGEVSQPGYSFCPEHKAICYRQPTAEEEI